MQSHESRCMRKLTRKLAYSYTMDNSAMDINTMNIRIMNNIIKEKA